MICTHCHQEIEDDAKVCPHCSEPVETDAEETEPVKEPLLDAKGKRQAIILAIVCVAAIVFSVMVK